MKKQYIQPQTHLVNIVTEPLMGAYSTGEPSATIGDGTVDAGNLESRGHNNLWAEDEE